MQHPELSGHRRYMGEALGVILTPLKRPTQFSVPSPGASQGAMGKESGLPESSYPQCGWWAVPQQRHLDSFTGAGSQLREASGSLRMGELGPLCIQTHPSSPASVSALWSHRRRKQRRGRYRGSCTHSGAARSSLMSRAWWSCSWLSDGARPTGGEPVLSCCTAGTPGCTSIHGQPPELGATRLHSSSAWYQQAFPSIPWGHVI